MAGFRVLRLITEPTAAALASKIHENREDDEEKVVLVFDFGGGTFDVTIGLIEDYNLVVQATAGDMRLGGRDLDNCIFDKCIEQIQSELRVRPDK